MKVIDTFTQEDLYGAFQKLLETAQQVHCSRRRLLRRGLEFPACTINKSAHTKKSGNLFNDPRIYKKSLSFFSKDSSNIYIYIYIYGKNFLKKNKMVVL